MGKRGLGDTRGALEDFKVAGVLDPGNKVVLKEIMECEEILGISKLKKMEVIKMVDKNVEKIVEKKPVRRRLVVREIGKKGDDVDDKDMIGIKPRDGILVPGMAQDEPQEYMKEVSTRRLK